jgi:hypothetical protein
VRACVGVCGRVCGRVCGCFYTNLRVRTCVVCGYVHGRVQACAGVRGRAWAGVCVCVCARVGVSSVSVRDASDAKFVRDAAPPHFVCKRALARARTRLLVLMCVRACVRACGKIWRR